MNEDILTALKNAVNNGETLDQAVQILINSGYDPRAVYEASRFLGGVSHSLQPLPEEQLDLSRKPQNLPPQTISQTQTQPQTPQQIQSQLASPVQLSQTTNQNIPSQRPPQTPTQPILPTQLPPNTQQNPPLSQKSQININVPQQTTLQPKPQQQSPQNQVAVLPPQNSVNQIGTMPPQHSQYPETSGQETLNHPIIQRQEKSFVKEIILLVVLLMLVGVLITTIFLKESILGWFSG